MDQSQSRRTRAKTEETGSRIDAVNELVIRGQRLEVRLAYASFLFMITGVTLLWRARYGAVARA